MVELAFDAATKKVSFTAASLDALDAGERAKAAESIDVVNELMAELVGCDGEVPPPPERLSTKVTTAAAKLHGSGMRALQAKKAEEAVKLLSTALEIVMRRPRWESTAVALEEVANCLVPRCDAYIMLEQWPRAYADVCMLGLVSPGRPGTLFRRGVILARSGKYAEGVELVRMASLADPKVAMYGAVLQQLEQDRAKQLAQEPGAEAK